MFRRELGQRIIQRQKPIRRIVDRQLDGIKADLLPASAPLDATFAPGIVHQNPTHGFGGGAEEVPARIPVLGVGLIDESEVRLVNEGGGLQGLVGALFAHL